MNDTPSPGSGSPADERACDDCEREGRNCTAHGGRPGIPPAPSTPVDEAERPNAAEDATWSCKIGPASRGDLPPGSDAPMRRAVEAAFRKLTGHDPEWTFSGWAHDLTEAERAVVEHRLPRPQVIAAAARKQMEQAEGAIGTDLDPEVPERGWEIHEPDDALRIVAAPASPVSPPVPERRDRDKLAIDVEDLLIDHCGSGGTAALTDRILALTDDYASAAPPVGEERRLDGAGLIAAERERQVTAEGWTPEHDDEHTIGELVDAAVCYLKHGLDAESPVIWPWPWAEDWWKPSDDPIRNLVRAGALIAAEIDRLTRAADDREDRA